jgi:hypothetical protein
MRRWLHRHSRISLSLLILALLAWTALPFDALAHSFAVTGRTGDHSAMVMAMDATAGAHCDGMSMASAPLAPDAVHPATSNPASSHPVSSHPASSHSATTQPAPAHPAHNGHGCCTGHGCYCASSFGGIAGVPHPALTWEPPHGSVLTPVQVAPAVTHAAPPLRPPIT